VDQDLSASQRKADHIDLALKAQADGLDTRFHYEPLFAPHPQGGFLPKPLVAGRLMQAPIWISSMTGGAQKAGTINRLLAEVAAEYGLGMGLGSCRMLLESDEYLNDFAIRRYIGSQPLFANLGIAQIEQLQQANSLKKIRDLVSKLEADGIIIHVNPLQEWLQPEGDKITQSPLDSIQRVLDTIDIPLMVKEVGQGFGPESLRALLNLPLEAVEFAAQGGTNFSLLEMMRADPFMREQYACLAAIGHSADDMTRCAADVIAGEKALKARHIIISGGIHNFLDGYYHMAQLQYPAMYAQASAFLKYALLGEKELHQFVEAQIKGLELAYQYLKIRQPHAK